MESFTRLLTILLRNKEDHIVLALQSAVICVKRRVQVFGMATTPVTNHATMIYAKGVLRVDRMISINKYLLVL